MSHSRILVCICFVSIFSFHSLHAQYQAPADSLRQVLETKISDKDRVATLIRLCDLYKNLDNTQIAQYAEPALSLAKKINYLEGLADAYYMKSATFIYSAAFDTSLTLLDSSLQIAEEINYANGIANVYRGKGHIALELNEYEKALEYFDKVLEIRTQMNDFSGIAHALNSYHIIYRHLGETDKALALLNEALALGEKHNLIEDKTMFLSNMGSLLTSKGEYEEALAYLQESLELAQTTGAKGEISRINNKIGYNYYNQGDYPQALEYYQTALNQLLEINRYAEIPNIYRDMAISQAYMGNPEKALALFNEGLEMSLKFGHKYDAASAYNNIGYLYTLQGDYDKSLEHLDKGLAMANELQSPSLLGTLYGSYGDLYLEMKDYGKVVYYLEKSLDISRKLGYKHDMAMQLTALSRYYLELKQYTKALTNGEEAISLTSEIGARLPLKDALGIKAKTLAALGQGMKAYETHVAYMAVADSLFNADKTKAFTRLEADYEFQQEKDSIQFATEKEKLALNATIESGKARQLATLIGLTAVGLILLVLGVFYYKNQKKNQLLTALNGEIQNQNIEIKSQRDHLNDLNKTKSKFFSIISHDLRSPMSSFQALSDVIDFNLKQENYDEIKEINQEVVKRSKEIGSLLDNLLSWAVNEEGQFPFNPTTVSVKEAIDEVVDIYLPVARYKNIELRNDADASHHIWADANSFKTIIRNLVSNAIKFTAAGGEIILSSRIENDKVLISVSDSGVGLNARQKQKLFENEVGQNSGIGTAGEKGVGLGLRLVRDFVKMNKGKIEVTSEEGKGSRFEISLLQYQNVEVNV